MRAPVRSLPPPRSSPNSVSNSGDNDTYFQLCSITSDARRPRAILTRAETDYRERASTRVRLERRTFTRWTLALATSDSARRGGTEGAHTPRWRKSAAGRSELNNARVKAAYTRRWISRELARSHTLTPGESWWLAPKIFPRNIATGGELYTRQWINAAGIGSIASDTTVIRQSDLPDEMRARASELTWVNTDLPPSSLAS